MIKFERSELAIFGLPDLSRSFGSAIKTDTCHFRKFLWSDRCSYFLAVLLLLLLHLFLLLPIIVFVLVSGLSSAATTR